MYLITYDLNKPGQEYSRIIAAIKALGACHWVLGSVWLIDTRYSALQITEFLKTRIDSNDRFLVAHRDADFSGWLDQADLAWIAQHP